MQLTKFKGMLFIVLCVAMFCIGVHLLDIGETIDNDNKDMNCKLNARYYLNATNGFFELEPVKLYHTGMYMAYAAFGMLVVFTTYIYSNNLER